MEAARSDEDLVRAFQVDPASSAGRAAAATLLQRWRSRVYAWCSWFVRDRERAMELSQDVLLAMYRALPGFETRDRFASWAYTIVRHRCLSELRRRKTERLRDDDELSVFDPALEPDESWEQRSELDRVLDLMRTHLDERERTALWLRAQEELSVEQITRVLGLDNATGARGLLQTARRKLRAALEGAGERTDPS